MAISRNAPCPCGSGEKYKKCHLAKDEAQRKPHTGEDAVIVCMPTRGAVSHETLLSLEHNMGGIRHGLLRIARKPVVEARNTLAKSALDMIASQPFPFIPREIFILWIDDDAWLPPGLVPHMIQCLREPSMKDLDALFAWFCARDPYSHPVAYRRFDDPESYPKPGLDCEPGKVVQIEAAGFHCVMMRARLLERLGPEPFTLDPAHQEGEDWAFCRRAKKIGARLAVATQMPCVHVDPRDGIGYLPGMPAMMFDGNGLRQMDLGHMTPTGGVKVGESRSYGMGTLEETAQAAAAETQTAFGDEIRRRRELWNGEPATHGDAVSL